MSAWVASLILGVAITLGSQPAPNDPERVIISPETWNQPHFDEPFFLSLVSLSFELNNQLSARSTPQPVVGSIAFRLSESPDPFRHVNPLVLTSFQIDEALDQSGRSLLGAIRQESYRVGRFHPFDSDVASGNLHIFLGDLVEIPRSISVLKGHYVAHDTFSSSSIDVSLVPTDTWDKSASDPDLQFFVPRTAARTRNDLTVLLKLPPPVPEFPAARIASVAIIEPDGGLTPIDIQPNILASTGLITSVKLVAPDPLSPPKLRVSVVRPAPAPTRTFEFRNIPIIDKPAASTALPLPRGQAPLSRAEIGYRVSNVYPAFEGNGMLLTPTAIHTYITIGDPVRATRPQESKLRLRFLDLLGSRKIVSTPKLTFDEVLDNNGKNLIDQVAASKHYVPSPPELIDRRGQPDPDWTIALDLTPLLPFADKITRIRGKLAVEYSTDPNTTRTTTLSFDLPFIPLTSCE